jgi:transposase
MKMFTHQREAGMIREEEYLMIRDLAQEQEITTGHINISELSRETGYDRKTIRKLLAQNKVPRNNKRRSRTGKLDPHKGYIQERLTKYPQLSGVRIHDEIRGQGYTGSYTLLKEYLRTVRPMPVVLPEYRYETKPGVQSQADWSECGFLLEGTVKKKIYCFNMILGYSRMRYIEFTHSLDLYAFIECHIHAFEYFGGVTHEILYDNLKPVVLTRRYPSTASDFHPIFTDFRDHFGFISRLCRPSRAKTKGKIERTVGYVKDNFLYGRQFNSLDDLNHQAKEWLDTANHRVHGTTYEIPAERLLKENLTPISSISPYILRRTIERKISKDCYLSLNGNRYSVPWRFARQNAVTEIRDQQVLISVDGEVVCEHPLLQGKHQISRNKEHIKGLLKEIFAQPVQRPTPKLPVMIVSQSDIVEHRPLTDYDAIPQRSALP